MKRTIGMVTLTAALWGGSVLPARAADPGLTVLTFLKLGAGARATTLGEAFVSVADDASATYWNPAGLLGIQHNDVLGTHHAWIQDLNHEFVGFGAHRGRSAIGFSFIGLYTSDIEARDETGAYSGMFGFSNNAFSASYAFQAAQDLGFGGTVRYVRESIVGTADGDFSLDGFAFDLGGQWKTPLRGVTAGAVLRNLGGSMSYNLQGAQSFDLPTALQAGLSYKRQEVGGGVLTVASDVLAARGDDVSFRAGAEYAYRGQYIVGAGVKSGLDNENVSFGVGYDNKIRVDYAFTPIQSDLGSSHRISVGYRW
jgi:uncharacterized protein UPF0164